jgi:hypothetical protein
VIARVITALVVMVLAACSTNNQLPSGGVNGAATPSVKPSSSANPVTMADAARCPTSKPSPEPAELANTIFASAVAIGNGKLWVAQQADGVIRADSQMIDKDGAISWKFGWFRVAAGELTITGRRVDAPAPPLRSEVPSGYGDAGFQPSGVYFPTEGCWEVSGHVGTTTLTFVTFVIKVD